MLARIERTNLILAAMVTGLAAGAVGRPRGDVEAGVGCGARLRGLLGAGAHRRPPGRERAGSAARRAPCRSCWWRKTMVLIALVFVSIARPAPGPVPVRARVLGVRGVDPSARPARGPPRSGGGLMGPHATWFDFIPGFGGLKERLQESLGASGTGRCSRPRLRAAHVPVALLVSRSSGLARPPTRARSAPRATPAWCRRKFGLRNLFETLADAVSRPDGGRDGREEREALPAADRHVLLFILFSNLLGAHPGFVPPTDTLKTNLALSVSVFLLTPHLRRARARPQVLQALPRAGLVAGAADAADRADQSHRAAGLAVPAPYGQHGRQPQGRVGVLRAVPDPVPVPFMLLGGLICVVQTVVFSLLTTCTSARPLPTKNIERRALATVPICR